MFIKVNHKTFYLLLLGCLYYQPVSSINLIEVVDYVLDTHPVILAN